jgi:hypothetical protein
LKRFLIALLVLGVSFSFIPTVSVASRAIYSLTIACTANAPYTIVGHADTIWNWTVNGVKIDGGYILCTSSNGSDTVTARGVIPASANGIVATLLAQRFCEKTVMTTQSFVAGSAPAIKLSAGCNGIEYKHGVSINATFSLT